MHLFIRKLVLWPKDTRLEKREIAFERGKINLITGKSGTGKSAILYIVDYVLGSGKCAIPVGPIRDTVAWYGLVLELGSSTMIVARKEPRGQVRSSEYYLQSKDTDSIPEVVSQNTNLAAFKNRMDRLAGLPSAAVDPSDEADSFSSRPSFRDMAAFNFLPQHIVANPYAMFFKADSTEHRAKLSAIFPFILGAVTAQHLAAKQEHAQLLKLVRRLENELRQRLQAAQVWKAEVLGLCQHAVELGLVPQDSREPATVSEGVALLSAIPDRLAEMGIPSIPSGGTERGARQLQSVRESEQSAARDLADTRRRIARITSMLRATESFGAAVEEGADRVRGVGWLKSKLQGSSACPVCGSEAIDARRRLDALSVAADELADQQRRAQDVPVALERELGQLSVLASAQEETVRDLRTQRAELEESRETAGGQRLDQVYRFSGRVEQSLKNLDQTEDDGDLRRKLDSTKERIAELAELVDLEQERRRVNTALRLVGEAIARFARSMNLERSQDLVSLVTRELTLKFESPGSGRRDYLWEVGSGANWMGYHISTFLALHAHFLTMDLSYVPSILLVDQPSQVYFPSGIPADEDDESDDVRATRRIFETLETGLRDTSYELQIIVTEHADERTIRASPKRAVAVSTPSEAAPLPEFPPPCPSPQSGGEAGETVASPW
jgi:energy-coupling factor transporter ATP-binding protein EcfA2